MNVLPTACSIWFQTLGLRKAAFAEGVNLPSIVNESSFPINEEPFRHAVIDDFLKPGPYRHVLEHFNAVIARGLAQEPKRGQFHPFPLIGGKLEYDGYLYIPDAHEPQVPRFFYTAAWNRLFSQAFNRPTGWCTSLAYHYHPPGDRTGFVHNDFTSKEFSWADRLSNGIVFREREKKGLPGEFTQRRTIALIYYLGNDQWREGDGGETGLYRSAGEMPELLVSPKNNRLLAFEISPKSLHAFQSNKTPRMSIVQWFHIDENYAEQKYRNPRNLVRRS